MPYAASIENREQLRPKASDYLKLVKRTLSAKGYQEFTQSLKEFKTRIISFNILLGKITKLFERLPGEVELLEGFQDFVPKKHKIEYTNLVMMAKRKTNKNT